MVICQTKILFFLAFSSHSVKKRRYLGIRKITNKGPPEQDAGRGQNTTLCCLVLFQQCITQRALEKKKKQPGGGRGEKTPTALAQTTFYSDLHMVTFMFRH